MTKRLTHLGHIQLAFVQQKNGLWKVLVTDNCGFGREVLHFWLPQKTFKLTELDKIVRSRLKRLGFEYTHASHFYGLVEKD